MGLVEQAQKDMQQFTSNTSDFGVAMTFTAPDASVAAVVGFHTKHHTGFDMDGVRINSKTASIAVSEQKLIDLSYPTRNAADEVDMMNHLVSVKDSSNVSRDYIVREMYPDEFLGLIVFILGDFE